jgi:hypothetical protein
MDPYVRAMTTFGELETAAPPIAAFFRDRIEKTGLSFVATTRADGWPRVSAWEAFLCDGGLYMGSMPNAVKARDLRRDPRCCIITPIADKDDLAGEAKLFCRGREITDVDEWERVRATFMDLRGFDMGEHGGSHLFTYDVEGAAFQRVEGESWRTTSWDAAGGLRERIREGALGESRDL